MRKYALMPRSGQKSFYGKATVYEIGGAQYLKSYNTFVAYIDAAGIFHRLWSDWSATTGRHIDAFTDGLVPNKATWDRMEVERIPEDVWKSAVVSLFN